MGQDTKEVGHEWGFTDPQEATSHKMTLTEYHQWFGVAQVGVMIAFKLDDDIIPQVQDEEDDIWWS